ncbi:MAG TPA: serine/threonine-protein kinase [Planctomycetota bacterium]|jgi:serine/threonine-protein kinase
MSDAPLSQSPLPTHLFGDIAQQLHLCEPWQIEEALRLQKSPEAIEHGRKIGEILHARHQLELRAIQKILLEQKRRREKDGVPPVALGTEIGPFMILGILGSGGMGLVYKVREKGNERLMALKILSLKLTEDAEFVARFQREVQTASALSHPNIVAGFGSGTLEGKPYLLMEYVAGRSLERLLETERRLPEPRALSIAREVARALDYAHSHGVVHRDVKPDNVLLGDDGSVKLTDFGLAKLMRENQRLTQSGVALGTPHYISPEQVEASRYIDHRADLYSLGAMLFQMLTGRVLFDGANNNEIMLRHLNEPPRDPREFVPSISDDTAKIIRKLLVKKAAERYDSAEQVIADIDSVLNHESPRYATIRPSIVKMPEDKNKGCASMLMLLFTLFAVAAAITRLAVD